jgi:predicted ATPase
MPPGLLGRELELAAIDELLDHIDDRGGALLVRGKAGLGKSALLDEAARRASDLGMSVLTTAGVPSERQMAFARLHRLLQPDFPRIADLPGPQRDALSSAFGLGNGAAPDLFLIALAALDLLAETAADTPLLLIVEDAHWLDAATGEALAFVARRLEAEP